MYMSMYIQSSNDYSNIDMFVLPTGTYLDSQHRARIYFTFSVYYLKHNGYDVFCFQSC